MSSIKPYIALLKSRLSLTVAFSGTFGYLLAPIEHKPLGIFLISLAGFVLTGAANIVNQLKEIELDKLMKRTAKRPLPTETLSPSQARNFGYVLATIALGLLSYFTWKAALIGLISYILYGYVYTPLKRVGPISVFVGAFPGAFPPMIGWVAATGHFGWKHDLAVHGQRGLHDLRGLLGHVGFGGSARADVAQHVPAVGGHLAWCQRR